MATNNGSSGDDTISGSTGADNLNGGAGADYLYGDAGSDRLNGGSGNDCLDGGSGSDVLNGDSGNDTLVYNLSENLNGSKDVYTGGSGIDTVLLQLSASQWLDSGVRAQLQAYIAHLASVRTNTQGEVSNGSASDFVFRFDNGTTLTVQMMEKLVVGVQNGPTGPYVPVDYLQSLITGPATGSVIEAGGVANGTAGTPTATGDLYADDLNGADDVFQDKPAGTATVNGYGSYELTAAGVWTYTLDDSHVAVQALNVGGTLNDSFTVLSADGTAQVVTVTINGTNDAAVITGTSSGDVTEAGGVANGTAGTPTATGDLLATDVDNAADAFQAVAAGAATVNGYGSYELTAAGVWTYTLDDSHAAVQALNVGGTLNDSFTVLSADGTAQLVSITINGTNDAAVLSADTRNLTETNAAADISTSGQLTISDVDSAETFVAQAATAGTYGTFAIDTAGAWTYTASSAHDEFVAGTTYTDTFSVASADGTLTSVTVHILGTNDAAVLSADTRNLTETNAAADISTSGQLTISDVDSAETFVAQAATAGTYGTFAIDTAGAWTYTASSAHDEFVAGTTYTDTFSVASADGTLTSVTVHILGTNDAAVLSADTRNLTETNAAADISTSGQLTISDVDSAETFVAQAATAGTYGTFAIDTAGAWTYTASSAHDEFVAGTTYTDTFSVASADGTLTSVTVHILGTNDAAVLSADTRNLTETNAAADISTSGQLTISDVDSAETFVAQAATAGTYGTFAIDTAGAWTYTASSAHDEFVAGTTYTDTFSVASADGTLTSVTVHILGTNDAAVLSADTRNLTETNAAADISTSGQLTISDVDSAETFVAQAATAGTYGTFAIDTAGAWTYTASSAHDEFVAGTTYTDTFSVASADGTLTSVTVHILGTNDAAVLSADTRNLTETNAAADISTSGQLTISDVDSAETFVAQAATAGTYGTFAIDTAGAWTYTASSAHDEFVAGTTYTDTFSVASADGTLTSVTVHILGTNDAAVLSADTRNLTETNAAADISTSGQLTISDVDSAETFVAQAATAGTYGTFAIDTAGAWTYTASSAHDEFVAGTTYTDTFSVASADGTLTSVTVHILGTNDAAVLSADTRNLTETNAAADISTSGQLTISDVDSAETFVAQAATAGTYGTFAIDTAGAWTYTASSAHDEFVAGTTYTDTFSVASADGTLTSVTVHILGTNDAAVLSADTRNLTETNAAADISTSGQLTISDVDSAETFVAQAATAGTYGTFAIDTAGAWTYTASSAHDEFVAGTTYTDTFSVASADGTLTSVTVHILGTNDAAVLSADTRNLTETNAAADISTSGQLTISDVDSAETFVAQAATAGTYGTFAIDTAGAWTYTASSAHDEFVAGTTYTDTFSVASADGTLTSVTVHILGTNDAAVLSADTRNLTETNAAADISTSGQLTISDVDSAETFVAQAATAGTYGTFAIDTAGAWTYTASSAHDEFVAGTTYTDTFSVASADGTLTSVTVHILGTNDAAVLSADTRNLTETNAAADISTSGQLTISDVDSAETFVAQAATAGTYGTFAIDTAGAWTYTASSAHDEFVAGTTYTDTFSVASADGTLTSVTVHILGTNDAAVLSADTRNLTETNAAADISTSGQLTISDVDSAETFVAQAATAGTYGTFAIDTAGAWTYTASSAHDEFVAGTTYTDTFSVASADGTLTSVTVHILGTNDAAVLSADTRNLTETNAAADISTSGQLTISDVDSAETFVAQAATAGTYGTFAIDTAGAWTYTASSAHDEFVAGTTYTDTFSVASADGTLTSVTVHILGTNDAAVLSADTRNLTETNAAADISTSGQLTISDVDSAETFVAQAATAGTYGTFAIDTAGAWTYTASSAHDEFVAGTTYTDTFSVASADGTLTSVTVHILGTNDAPLLNAAATPILGAGNEDAGSPVGAVGTLVSSLVDLNPPAGGLNNVTDVDSGAVTGIALTGTNSADGTWYYSTNNGANWTAVGIVSNSLSLLLAANANTRLYFQANANFNGDVTNAITFRAWDQTSGTAGTKVDTDTFNNGGSTAFSTATDTANLTVTAVNDSPVVQNDTIYVSNNTAVTMSLSTLLGNDTDTDGLALSVTALSATAGQFLSGPTLNTDGTFSFTTNAAGGSVAGPTVRTITYTVWDGVAGSVTTTGTVTVNVIAVDTGSGDQDTVNLSGVAAYQGSFIDGKTNQDTITDGNAGSILIGGTQVDTLNGTDGNDILRGGAGGDNLNGGLGIDLLDFSDASDGFNLTFVSGSGSVANSVTGLGSDNYTGMEGVIGSNSAAVGAGDTLSGSAALATNDVFHGMAGDDSLNGNLGNDTLRGGAGNDTINGGLGIDLLDFYDATGAVNFTLVQSASNTTVAAAATPGLGQDIYSNMEGVIGSSYNDVLNGSSSGDVIIGGAGADILTGGTGSDTFRYRNGDASAVDTITDFNSLAPGSGGDVLDISDLLGGAVVTGGNVADYLDIRESGGNSIVSIDRNGTTGGSNFQDFAVLTGVTGLSLTSLFANLNIDTTP